MRLSFDVSLQCTGLNRHACRRTNLMLRAKRERNYKHIRTRNIAEIQCLVNYGFIFLQFVFKMQELDPSTSNNSFSILRRPDRFRWPPSSLISGWEVQRREREADHLHLARAEFTPLWAAVFISDFHRVSSNSKFAIKWRSSPAADNPPLVHKPLMP